MPRATQQRTFTACWTCRKRNIRCDAAVPCCSQCTRSRIICEGYHFNLVWVDSATGNYIPQQRRAYPCHLTWQDYPTWTLREVAHLISDCEYRQCQCRLHQGLNPFSAFPQACENAKPADADEGDMAEDVLRSTPAINMNMVDFGNFTFLDGGDGDPRGIHGTRCSASEVATPESRISGTFVQPVSSTPSGKDQELVQQKTGIFLRQYTRKALISLIKQPTQPWIVDSSQDDNKLFHHFLSHLAKRMVPVDDDFNPWKTIYPALAMQTTRSSGARALYHALLAQSAFHLANLRGVEEGAQEQASAVRHYGIALRQLRESLVAPSNDYSTVLAALYTVILAEHVFQGTSSGWQSHIRGARGFVSQYLGEQPWRQSQEAYIITQNFGLAVVISNTIDIKFLSAGIDDGVSEIDDLLHDLMERPVFGYTLGGTPHMLRAIYQTRLLEARINARRSTNEAAELDEDMFAQVGQILQLLYVPLGDKLETYMSHRELSGITILPRIRTLARIHLRLFDTAVKIYLYCLVLQCPPSAVAQDVWQVLSDAASFIELHDGTVSIWPVFVAAAEAYTPESQALATHCLEVFKDGGAGNRRDIKCVIHQVWSDREKLASELQCDPGEVLLDWRDVMKSLNADILLL